LLHFVERTARERKQGREGPKGIVRWIGEEEEGDIELARACKGTRSLVRTAFETCKPGTIGRAILEYVNRKETGGDHPSTKAFDGSRKPLSIK
jgi:hypothetical protein